MLTPQIFVFEQTPHWLPELQRQFQCEDVGVQGCESLTSAQLRTSIKKTGDDLTLALNAAVIVLELKNSAAGCLQFLERQHRLRYQLPGIVISDTRHQELEWFFREVGAKSFVLNTISGEHLALLCRRHWF